MLLALALAHAQTSPSLATYEQAVADATRAVTAALPRMAACQRPAAPRLVFKVALADGGKVSTVAVAESGGTKVAAPCLEKMLQDVFLRAPPPVGVEAAVVVDTAAGLRLDGDVALLGALPNEAVEAGIRARMDRIAECYVGGLAGTPGLKGQLVVAFTVLPDGRVLAPEVKRTELWNPGMEACVLREVAASTFAPPESGAIVRVTYPFTFNPP
jgi:hypothetical protein